MNQRERRRYIELEAWEILARRLNMFVNKVPFVHVTTISLLMRFSTGALFQVYRK